MPKRRNEEGDREDGDLKDDVIQIEPITADEDDDGFGTGLTDGPDNAAVRREQREVARDKRTGRFVKDDEESDAEFAYNIEDDDEDDEGGGSRRRRRNRARRDAAARSNMVIGQLQHEVQQLRGAMAEMGRGQVGLAAGEIDSRLQQEYGYMSQIDAAIEKAMADGDGRTFAKAQALRDEARERIQALRFHQAQLQQRMQDPGPAAYAPNTQQQQQNGPDPRAVRYSEMFMDRHPWFDPDGTDADSRMVVYLENELASEGSKPTSRKHWQELEKLVRERGLGGDDGGGDDDVDTSEYDDRPKRRTRPTSGRSGGRPGGTSFKLTPMMREALDSEGLLDEKGLTEDQQKRRTKLVKQWASGMAEARKAGKL